MAKSSFDRREFLKFSALNASALAFSGCTSLDRFFMGDKRDLTGSVAILGAGAAGLAAAFELKKRKIPYRIFEASSRVGGRVQSISVFPGLGPVAELGAEFFSSDHQAVFDFAKEFNLSVTEIKNPANLQSHLFYFGKKTFRVKDIAPRLKTINAPFSRIISDLFHNQEADLNFENALEFERSTYYDSLSLRDLLESWSREVDPLVLQLIEIQAVNRFGVDAKDQSALHFLTTINAQGSSLLSGQATYRIKGGVSQVTDSLATRVAGVIADQIVKLNHPLVKISEKDHVFELTFNGPQGKDIVKASHVICTIPFSSLRAVSGIDDLQLSPLKKEAIRIQSYATHSKGVVGFAKPFWRETLGSVPGNLGNFTGDFISQKIWDSGRGQEGSQGLLTFQRGGSAGANAGTNASNEALKDLGLFYNEMPSSMRSVDLTMNWERKQWSRGSMAVFKPGQYMRFKGAAAIPEYGGQLWFAGEHASARYAGTLQGALESGIKAAQQIAEKLTTSQG